MPAFIDENQQFIDPDTSAPIVAGQIFFGVKGSNPTDAPIDVFTNRQLTTTINQPILTDASGRTTVKIWIPGLYSFKVLSSVASGGTQKLIDLDAGTSEAEGTAVLTNIIGSDNITAQATPVITTLIDGTQFTFTAVAVNTAKMTLNIDGLGAKPIKFNFNEEMAPGFIRQNQIINLTYNAVGAPTSDNFIWNNEGRGISLLTSVAGTGDAITAVGGPSITTNYVPGQLYSFIATANNTGAVTLTIGTLPTVSLKKNNDVELAAGDIQASQNVIVTFNASQNIFQVISQLSLANQFFVQSKMCIPFFDVIANIPAGYLLCDGSNGTPNLVGRFLKGSDATGSNNGTLGGSTTTGSTTLTTSQIPSHNHSVPFSQAAITAGSSAGGVGLINAADTITGNTGGGSGHTHPNLDPLFTNVLWIMKT